MAYETGIDWSDCPIMKVNPRKMSGRPTVPDWRMPADQVVEEHDFGTTAEEIAEWPRLPSEDVRTILAHAAKARELANSVR